MNVIFNELALEEFVDTINFYELELPGLGDIFKNEIRKAILRISEHPNSWPKLSKNIRKYILHKFPYKILYSIESDPIYIVAISHQHRKPDYWIDRYLKK